MNPIAYTGLVTIIVAVISVVGTGWYGRRPQNISGAREITESALLLIQPQSERITELVASVDKMSRQVDHLTNKIIRLESHVDVLVRQIVDMGAEPKTLENL